MVVFLYDFISYGFLGNKTAHFTNINLSLLYHELLKGNVRLIFQPTKEGGGGTAHMICEGALGDAEARFEMHFTPIQLTGTIASKPRANFCRVGHF